MKKTICILMTAGLLMLPATPAMAGKNEDRITELENKVATLETTVSSLTTIVQELVNNAAGQTQTEAPAAPELPGAQIIENVVVDYEGLRFVCDHYEVTENSDGNCLLIYGNFQNNADEAKNAALSINMNVYQNSRELDSAYIRDNAAYSDRMTNILPGGNIDVCFAFELLDMSDVTVDVSALFDFYKDSKQQFVLHLQ